MVLKQSQEIIGMLSRIIRLIGMLAMITMLSACRLAFSGQDDAESTLTPLPTQVAVVVTATPLKVTTPLPVNTSIPRPTTVPVQNPPVVQPPACTPRNDWQTYTIQAGDTLSAIARRTSSTVAILTTANCLSNPNAIAVGQALRVPSAPVPPTVTPVPPVPAPPQPPVTGCSGQMLVTAGLRAGPGDQYGSITQVAGADTFAVVERSGTGWYRLAVPGLNQPAWINAALLGLHQNCNGGLAVPVNSAGTIGGTKAFTYDVGAKLAFDYPASWYSGVNTDGLPGGYVGTFPMSMMPPTAMAWSTEMVIVSFVIYPDGVLPGGGSDMLAQAQADVAGIRQMQSRIGVVRDPVSYSTASLSGVMYELSGPGMGRVYYFNLNGQFVQFGVAGNFVVGESVVNTLRVIP
jgi:LysM repeat protein